jgi:predicted nucleic acid-binding protein
MSGMSKTLVYLDVCCFNRPYDDQAHPLVMLETEAKLLIQAEIANGNLDLVWSFMLHYENNDNPYADRKKQIALWEAQASKIITFTHDIQLQADLLMPLGIKTKDAVHLACTIAARADYFITTDKKLLNKNVGAIPIINPMDFVRRHFHES